MNAGMKWHKILGDPLAADCMWWLGDMLEIHADLQQPRHHRMPAHAKLLQQVEAAIDELHAVIEPYWIRRHESEGGEVWDLLDTAEELIEHGRSIERSSFEALRASCREAVCSVSLRDWRAAHTPPERSPGFPAGPDD
jgi:hypothetical protein